MTLQLFREQTCFIEPIRLSGYTDSGIYVFDHDNTKNVYDGSPFSMMVRVTDTHKCEEILPGRVYIVNNPYNYSRVDHDGQIKYVMSEQNLLAEVENYDDDQGLVDDRYPVCTR